MSITRVPQIRVTHDPLWYGPFDVSYRVDLPLMPDSDPDPIEDRLTVRLCRDELVELRDQIEASLAAPVRSNKEGTDA